MTTESFHTTSLTITEETQEIYVKEKFQPVDYVVFALLLCVSAAVGVYFFIKERKNRNSEDLTGDYLMAGRSMTYGPVAMSLIASFMSSVTILGVPAEYYTYGTMFSWYIIPYAILPLIIGWVYMPVFYDLGLKSTYEYLKLRFNNSTKILAIALYMIVSTMYGGVVVYGPSIALSEVTGFNEWIAILTTGVCCMFYTSLGGLKAVIWTDVIQTVVMMFGFVAVIIQGSINQGGFGNIWRDAVEGGRIDFVHFELDPRIRHTFWSITIGGTVFWLATNGLNQAQVQRYVCCKSKKHAKIAIILNSIGLIIILVLAGMTGLVIYSTYKNCDPIKNNQIGKGDQLFPFIVMDILSYIPGVPGMFVAGVYSSSLSTISSGINAMACVTLEDFIRPYTSWSEKSYKNLSRFLVIFFGLIYILFAYIASIIGGLIRMAYTVLGAIGGALVGLFTMGLMMPKVNSWGAIIGTLVGFGLNVWKFVGTQMWPKPAEFRRVMPVSTEECVAAVDLSTQSYYNTTDMNAAYLNTTTSTASIELVPERPPITFFYDISYIYISPIGAIITIIVGLLVSALTGFNGDEEIDDKLLCEFLRKKKTASSSEGPLERSDSWVPPKTPLLEQGEGSVYKRATQPPNNVQIDRESSF